jgi:hypothetical protein
MKLFYRIGNQSTGLWYNQSGEFTGNIHKDELNWLQAAHLTMPFSEELVNYISVADSLEHLYQWFTKQEIRILQTKGFFIEEWIAEDFKFYDLYKHNVINQKTSILNNKLIIV